MTNQCGCSKSTAVAKEPKLFDKSAFETSLDGKQISLYTLKNSSGMVMQVTNYGGRVVSLWAVDKDGAWGDVVLGYENIQRYLSGEGERYLGATIGRYGNRIAKGKFILDGEEYSLLVNNGANALHGGEKAFDRVVWNVEKATDSELHMSYLSKDGEEGFPGNLSVEMIYKLTDDNEFIVEHRATTDKATPVNLTHHSFFNLKGEGNGTINDHVLTIAASKFVPVDETSIPKGELAEVAGTPFDFLTPHTIGERIEAQDEQLVNCKGYDHTYVIDRKTESDLEFAASVLEPQSGRYMEVWTTEPGMQFYGGNWFDNTTCGKWGAPLKERESFALETQHYPDSPNQPQFPSTILRPGEKYLHICSYKFSVK